MCTIGAMSTTDTKGSQIFEVTFCTCHKTQWHTTIWIHMASSEVVGDTKTLWAESKHLNRKGSTPIASIIGMSTGPKLLQNNAKFIITTFQTLYLQADITKFPQTTRYYNETLTVVGVRNIIADPKLAKASGLDALSAEHLQYASDRILVLLSLCFNAMLIHSYVPKTFRDTVLVPIIKDKNGDITDIDNYRPIATTSVTSKVFEKISLSRIQDCFYTNDNQFSNMVKHSAEMCIFTLRSIINYYISSTSSVYLCYIDASKAFDRINFWNLVYRLIDRNMPVILVRSLCHGIVHRNS